MKKKLSKELSADQLDDVSGGFGYYNPYGADDQEWEFINDKTGAVMHRDESKEDVQGWAKELGHSTKQISWNDVVKLRED